MRSVDAVGAFSHLSDNIPSWINRVSQLAAYTAAKNAEYSEAYRRHAVTGKPRRRKNSSLCSIRTADLDKPCTNDDAEPTTAPGSTSATPSTPNGNGNTTNPLKRARDEAFSLRSSDQMTVVSTRHNVIIHYDGHTQKSLEDVVRDIGTARNNIRKGKMCQLQAYSSRPPAPRAMRAMLPDDKAEVEGNEPTPVLLPGMRSTRMRNRGRPSSHQECSFDLADKHLELIHSLCETAAYQFLRTGDCGSELRSVRDELHLLLDIAKKETPRLREEQRQQQQQEVAEETAVEETADDFKLPSADGAIEVDEAEDASVESIDLSAFRVNRNRNRYRA